MRECAYTALRCAIQTDICPADYYKEKSGKLGPDPLREDADSERLWDKIKTSKKPVGGILMDQTAVAGIGNIYRAEILFKVRSWTRLQLLALSCRASLRDQALLFPSLPPPPPVLHLELKPSNKQGHTEEHVLPSSSSFFCLQVWSAPQAYGFVRSYDQDYH